MRLRNQDAGGPLGKKVNLSLATTYLLAYYTQGINRMYVNPNIYASAFPLLTGCLLVLNGQLWIDMAFTFFRNPHYIHPWELTNMAFHLGFTRVAAHAGFQLAVLFVICFIAKKLDQVIVKRRGGFEHQLELEIICKHSISSSE
jgi:hypothetical protein